MLATWMCVIIVLSLAVCMMCIDGGDMNELCILLVLRQRGALVLLTKLNPESICSLF
jgi:hypothetical protein